jgi:hypothetical protein
MAADEPTSKALRWEGSGKGWQSASSDDPVAGSRCIAPATAPQNFTMAMDVITRILGGYSPFPLGVQKMKPWAGLFLVPPHFL